MGDEVSVPSKKDLQRRQRRKVVRNTLIVVAIVVVPVALYQGSLEYLIDRELSAIRAKDQPVTLEDLEARYPDPAPSENGATLYRQGHKKQVPAPAGSKYESVPISGAESEKVPRDPDEKLLELTREYLAKNRKALEKYHEAASAKHFRYVDDLAKGLFAPRGPLKDRAWEWIRDSADLLATEAWFHAVQGRPEQTKEALVAGLTLADSIRTPLEWAYLTRWVTQKTATDMVRRVLAKEVLRPGELRAVRDRLKALEAKDAYRSVLIGERCVQHASYSKFGAPPFLAGTGGAKIGLLDLVGISEINQIDTLRRMRRLIAAVERPGPDRIQASQQIEHNTEKKLSFFYWMSKTTTAGHVQLAVHGLERPADARATHIAIDIELHRLETGERPSSLAELRSDDGSELPKDPYTEEPFHYERRKDGCVIYAAGPDGDDDGGRDVNAHEEDGDVVFRIGATPADDEKE